MNYQESLKKHLSEYKKKHFPKSKIGFFNYRGTLYEKGYILDKNEKELNFLEPFKNEIKKFLDTNQQIKFHMYFHHLNSSQALAMNLFIPFFENCLDPKLLIKSFGQSGTIKKWALEEIPIPKEESNLDVTWELDDGTKVICEVKLSETEFGKAKNDDDHKNKYENIYSKELQKLFIAGIEIMPVFFKYYQIYRNIWHSLHYKKAKVVFLMPRGNYNLWKKYNNALEYLNENIKQQVSAISLEDIFEILVISNNVECINYVSMLKEKYIPDLS